MNKSFDDNLTEDQRRRAEILRKSHRPQPEYVRPDPPAPGKLERFDDIFSHPSDIARSQELRRRAKAELYWADANKDEKESIRAAVSNEDPYRGNELFTRYFLRRHLDDIITDDNVLNYIIHRVLAL